MADDTHQRWSERKLDDAASSAFGCAGVGQQAEEKWAERSSLGDLKRVEVVFIACLLDQTACGLAV